MGINGGYIVLLLCVVKVYGDMASNTRTTDRGALECEFPPHTEEDLTHVRRKRLATIGGLVCLEDYPYTVSIRANNFHICGGALVSRQWVLSAAECFDNVDVDAVTVRAGSVFRDYGGVLLAAVRIETHPNYKEQSPEHNLALIKVNVQVELGPRMQPVRLPVHNQMPTGTGEIVVTGYGAVSGEMHRGVQQELRRMIVRSFPKERCRLKHVAPFSLQDDHACLQCVAPGVELCAGDVGDPAVYFSGMERAGTLHSVAVYPGTAAECPPRGPGVYSVVALSRDWIDLVLSGNVSGDSDSGEESGDEDWDNPIDGDDVGSGSVE